MDITQFLKYLKHRLSGCGKTAADDACSYYAEILAEKVAEGYTEIEAVASLGDPEEVVREAISAMPAQEYKTYEPVKDDIVEKGKKAYEAAKKAAKKVFTKENMGKAGAILKAVLLWTVYVLLLCVWIGAVSALVFFTAATVIWCVEGLLLSDGGNSAIMILGITLMASSVLTYFDYLLIRIFKRKIKMLTKRINARARSGFTVGGAAQ